jgi:4-amino-4-deoxy-L-arabinose transferase-like glycosyltransferase
VGGLLNWGRFPRRGEYMKNAAFAGICTGLGTLFRPETPLLLLSGLLVVFWVAWRRRQPGKGLRASALSLAACFCVLLPWTIRNAVTLHEFQPLSPRYSTMPGELVPIGFMNWERTWLYRFREVFQVSWKLNDDSIEVDDIPARAFDSPEERQHVAAILERYNNDSNLTSEEDQQFAEIARARTARHPFRTYLWVPLQRTLTLWFTPRIEQLPISGSVFPLAEMWDTDRQDMVVTVGFFFVNIMYVSLALWGAARVWSKSADARAAVILLVCFILLRTAFLTTIETPEPRYVLVCFPAVIALAAQALARRHPV